MNRKPGKSWKNSVIRYYIAGIWRCILTPRAISRLKKKICLHGWEQRPDADIIRRRVAYYCQLPDNSGLSPTARKIKDIHLKDSHSRYWFDLMRWLRAFPKRNKIDFIDGDTWENPDSPTFCKARRIDDKMRNCVLINMDSLRHFTNVKDNIPFEEKENVLFFRGEIHGKPHRIRFFEKWAGHKDFNIGDTARNWSSPWPAERVTIPEHFRYKYILALEGNDVATSLQWICGSNCIPVMIRPTVESWLMHGAMLPGIHYIEISPDFSDVAEKIAYYNSHPEEAKKISESSKAWLSQFHDPRREAIISYLTADSYFRHTR